MFISRQVSKSISLLNAQTLKTSYSLYPIRRKYATGKEEELSEEEKEIRAKIAKIPKPYIYQAVVPRPRRGLNHRSFLKLIKDKKHNYDFEQYADGKISSWEDLFLMKSEQLKKLEIPVKERKHILRWVNWYRQGRTPGHIKPKELKKKRYLRQSTAPMMYEHEKTLRQNFSVKPKILRVIEQLEKQNQ